MKVETLMKKQVASCRPTDSLGRAAQLMWDHDCGCVPVVDDDGRVVGLVTDRDGFMAGWTQGRPLSAIPVTTAMAHKVLTCRPGDTIESAEKVMREAQVRRLPVVDAEGRLAGILSLSDLARCLHQTAGAKGDGLSSQSVALTLSAISAPHNPVDMAS